MKSGSLHYIIPDVKKVINEKGKTLDSGMMNFLKFFKNTVDKIESKKNNFLILAADIIEN